MNWRHIQGMIMTAEHARVLTGGILVASVVALGLAFTAQYAFGARPCILCLYQRIPYAAAAVIATGALILLRRDSRCHARIGLACGAVFLAAVVLSAYHVGVEQHWWASVAGCAADTQGRFTVSELRAAMTGEPPLAACDEVSFRILGLSLAAWNALYATALAAMCLIGASLIWRPRR